MSLGSLAQRSIRVALKFLCAKRDALIDAAAFTNRAGLTNHHSGSVVNEYAAANLRPGMNINPRGRVCNLRKHARQDRHFSNP